MMDYTNQPFANNYEIPDEITEYQLISTERKDDWMAKWIWDKDNLTQNNVWMCFNKKVFLMTPYHHHLEKIGWKETDIVKVFWFVGLILSMMAITFGVWI